MTAVLHKHVRWLVCLVGLAPVGCTSEPAAALPAPAPGLTFDVTPRPISVIPPGTVVGDGPPEGWTHLLVKSYPRAGAGDVERLKGEMKKLADKLFSVMLARVEVEPGSTPPRYVLKEVASGVGTSIDGRDVVISKETYKKQGADLGFFGDWAVESAYGRVKAAAVVLRSDTLAVYDSPMIMLRDGKHAPVVLRYVYMLDPATGRVEALQWFMDAADDGTYLDAHGPMELLKQNHVENRVIHVDASKFGLLDTLTEQSLALTKLYTGRKQIPFPEGFQQRAAQKPFTAESAAEFDATLRRLVREADAP